MVKKTFPIPYSTKFVHIEVESEKTKVAIMGKLPHLEVHVHDSKGWTGYFGRRCPRCEWLKDAMDFYSKSSCCKVCSIKTVRDRQDKAKKRSRLKANASEASKDFHQMLESIKRTTGDASKTNVNDVVLPKNWGIVDGRPF